MIVTNEFQKEVFPKGTKFQTLLAYGIKEGVNKLEEVLRNTYTHNDAQLIINTINALNAK
tara:strand:- start:2690 stop:2869 length:180 start_codon:yes stop_codon:yes gene_type:complete